MSEGGVYVWVRRTIDWTDEAAFLAQLRPELRGPVALWNDTFQMPFHLFRHEVRRIAAVNHSRVRGATVADWNAIPDGALVLPTDDDDWFAPDVVSALGPAVARHEVGCVWIQTHIEVAQSAPHAAELILRRLLPWLPPRMICGTNGYALRKGVVDRLLLEKHGRASKWAARGGRSLLRRIDRRLSVANRTLASTTSLYWHRRPLDRRTLLRKYWRCRAAYDKLPSFTELSWCEPYVRMMAALMANLLIRGSGNGR